MHNNQRKIRQRCRMLNNWGWMTILLLTIISLTVVNEAQEIESSDNLSQCVQYAEAAIDKIDNEEVTPETWRSVHLEMQKPDGSLVKIDLLRPLWWLEEGAVEVGGTVLLTMPEMGIDGEATVVSMDRCRVDSRAAAPNYRVVTGKFTHENAIVLDLLFNDAVTDPLGVTPNHLLWSATRHAWVEAGQLKIGEDVKTVDGVVRLTGRNHRPGRHKVYNIEVHKDHAYYVSNFGILVHNSYAVKKPIWNPTDSKTSVQNAYGHWKKHGNQFPQCKNAKQYVDASHNFINNPPKGTLVKTRSNGEIILYDPQTNTFAVQAVNGAPKTMFKPDPAVHGYPTNLDYFNAQ